MNLKRPGSSILILGFLIIFACSSSLRNVKKNTKKPRQEIGITKITLIKLKNDKSMSSVNDLSQATPHIVSLFINRRNEDISKCLIIVVDDIGAQQSEFIRELVTRTEMPVVILLYSIESEINSSRPTSQVDKYKHYFNFLTSALNQGCNYYIIYLNCRNSALNITILLRESEKLAMRRFPSNYIFVPKLRKLSQSGSNMKNAGVLMQNWCNYIEIKEKLTPNFVKDWLTSADERNICNIKSNTSFQNHVDCCQQLKWKYDENKKIQIPVGSKLEELRCTYNVSLNTSNFNDITSIFCLQEMDSVANAIVLREKTLENNEIGFELVTNSFRNRYPNITLQTLCEWNGTNLIPEDCEPFPDKLSNMNGRNLIISTFSWYFPYISMKYLDGTENRLVAELSRRMNFTFTIEIQKEWGTSYPNRTGKGIHGDLLSGYSDIGVGGMFLVYKNSLYFDFTMPYLINGITLLVPRPKQVPLWLSIVAPFKISLWLLVIGSVLTSSVALYVCALLFSQRWHFLKYFDFHMDFTHCLLTVVGQLTLKPINRWPIESSLRHLLTWQFIFFVLIATCYKSSLIGFLRNRQYEKTIDTLEEFTTVPNLYWTAIDESWSNLMASFSGSALKTVYSRYKRFPNTSAINMALHYGNLAIAVEHLATGGYSGADYINKDFIASSMWQMTGDLSTTMVAMELQRGSPYAKHFDQIINRLVTAGIIRQWEVLSWVYTDQWRKKLGKITTTKFGLVENLNSGPPVVLKLSHLHGVFLLLIAGLSVSFVAFLIEMRRIF